MTRSGLKACVMVGVLALACGPASAQTVQDLQAQIDALKAQIQLLMAERTTPAPARDVMPAMPTGSVQATASVGAAGTGGAAPVALAQAREPARPAHAGLKFRGYTQMRYNSFLSGDDTAPAGQSRLRSVHDASINENGNFSLRRVRLVLQGDISDTVSLYLQHDFGSAVNNQSNGERREHFGQLRDAYVDLFLDKGHDFRLRFGQSKVPFGWENMQSSSNRLTLDRSDGINAAVPSERDLGIVAYYTPQQVQDVWDRLEKGGQKLFGNYGAFGVGLFNGQGVNRTEQNGNLMKVAMGTWPFELDGLGGLFSGQVLEVGGAVIVNKIRPEIRAGGVSLRDYDDNHVGVHAILYPQPFGIQAEWSWGRGPEYDVALKDIRTRGLHGGYVQIMADVGDIGMGKLMPYGRWQRYRGGWKAGTNAPRLETDEWELGLEWRVMKELEMTLAYANMKRAEADERRTGRAEGQLLRTQLQWNY